MDILPLRDLLEILFLDRRDLLEILFLDRRRESTPLEGIGTGNPLREFAEVTHTLPHRMWCVPLCK